jgi:hypothetical protein
MTEDPIDHVSRYRLVGEVPHHVAAANGVVQLHLARR